MTQIRLKEIKIHSPDKLILGCENVNSIRQKFDSLVLYARQKRWHLYYFLDESGWFISFGPICNRRFHHLI